MMYEFYFFDIAFLVIFAIAMILFFVVFINGFVKTTRQSKKVNRYVEDLFSQAISQTTKQPVKADDHGNTTHEDHTQKMPHDPHRTYRKNQERDVVKDPPLSKAERNVLRGK